MGDATPGQKALLALESRVLRDAKGGWASDIPELRRMLAAQDPGIRAKVLALTAPKVEGPLSAGVVEAFGIGRADALRILKGQHVKVGGKALAKTRGPVIPDGIKGLDKQAADAVAVASRLYAAGAPDDAALAPIFAADNAINRTIASSINGAGNDGTTVVANAADVGTVWQAETDACLDCLAYSGQQCAPGDQFPGGLTFGDSPVQPDAIDAPPLHPSCRCTVEPSASDDYAQALQREAQRSVLRGYSLESESMPARIRAAERLVKSNPDAPKSVIAYAAKSVKAGKFPTRGRPNP